MSEHDNDNTGHFCIAELAMAVQTCQEMAEATRQVVDCEPSDPGIARAAQRAAVLVPLAAEALSGLALAFMAAPDVDDADDEDIDEELGPDPLDDTLEPADDERASPEESAEWNAMTEQQKKQRAAAIVQEVLTTPAPEIIAPAPEPAKKKRGRPAKKTRK